MIVIKLAIQLLLKAGLISLFVCGLSLIVRAETGAKIFQLRPGVTEPPQPENTLLTIEQSIEALQKAQASIGASVDSKSEILAAIDGVGAYQFTSDRMSREVMDNLITSLLRLYGRDEDVSTAVKNKLGELSREIFSRRNKSVFLPFLSYQIQLRVSASPISELSKYMAILEAVQPHSSQLNMLWELYSKPVDLEMRLRIFNQIYNVLMDPDLQHNGQFAPDYTVASGIRKFLKDAGDRPLEPAELEKISNLIARFEKIKHKDQLATRDVLRSLVQLTANHPEFEIKLEEYAKRTFESKSLLEALQDQLDRGIPISAAQVRVLKSRHIDLDSEKKWRFELLKTTPAVNVFQLKRATRECHSFYGNN